MVREEVVVEEVAVVVVVVVVAVAPVTPRQREVVEVGVEQAEARDHERARRGAAGEDDACGGVVSPEKEKERRVREEPHDAEGHPSERPHEIGRVLPRKKEQRAAAEDN